MTKHVVVLMGGTSLEREISLLSGQNCVEILKQLGYKVTQLEISDNFGDASLFVRIQELRPDVVFNALHGPFGEDGKIQSILEYLNIAYTHSGVLASALAMDKAKAKIIVQSAGVKVAPSLIVKRADLANGHPMEAPYVIKPINQGSSFGIYIIDSEDIEIPKEIYDELDLADEELMIEKYIPGREFSCGVMGDEVLDVSEIFISDHYKFYDLGAKYQSGGSTHCCPAEISPNIYKDMQIMSYAAHKAIGCRGVSRSDFRFNQETGELIWLEINTQPGMTASSLLPEMAAVRNISFQELVHWIVEDASCNR